MSGLGQKQTFAVQKNMSALFPKADMCGALAHVWFVPMADIQSYPWPSRGFQTNTAARGSVTMISVNSPGCVSTSMVPACCFTMTS